MNEKLGNLLAKRKEETGRNKIYYIIAKEGGILFLSVRLRSLMRLGKQIIDSDRVFFYSYYKVSSSFGLCYFEVSSSLIHADTFKTNYLRCFRR